MAKTTNTNTTTNASITGSKLAEITSVAEDALDDVSLIKVAFRALKRTVLTLDNSLKVAHNSTSALEVLTQPLETMAESQANFWIAKTDLRKAVKFEALLKENKKLVDKYSLTNPLLSELKSNDLEDWQEELMKSVQNDK